MLGNSSEAKNKPTYFCTGTLSESSPKDADEISEIGRETAMNGIQNDRQHIQANEANAYRTTEKAKPSLTKGTDTDIGTSSKLSDEAKSLLKEMQQKYSNMDIFVADYSSDAEAQKYLSRGTKQYSMLIEPELLEMMARDGKEKDKYFGIIDNASQKISDMKDKVEKAAKKNPLGHSSIKSLGFSVSDDGSVDFFAELEKTGEEQKKRIEKSREARKAEKETLVKKNGGQAPRKVKTALVHGRDIDDLIKNIEKTDWNSIQTKKEWNKSKLDLGA